MLQLASFVDIFNICLREIFHGYQTVANTSADISVPSFRFPLDFLEKRPFTLASIKL